MIRDVKTVYFLVPGLSERYRSGGLLVSQRIAALLNETGDFSCRFIATHEKCSGAETPPDFFSKSKIRNSKLIQNSSFINSLFVISWGPLAAEHIRLIRANILDARITYYAQSFGWGVKLPTEIPVACVSWYVERCWRESGAKNRLCVIPPPLDSIFSFEEAPRDIDVLVHTRKQNVYCLKKLVPALEKESGLMVRMIHNWIPQEEFASLLKCTKLFLYITAPHKFSFFRKPFAEGFGLPALEAAACGTLVGSNLLGGVADFLVPGGNCLRLGENLEDDIASIRGVLRGFQADKAATKKIAADYSPNLVKKQWVDFISAHFDL